MSELSRYPIEREIAAGGMGTVYLARDERLGRPVALKILHPHLMGREEVRRRFAREASAIAALSHENIVKLFDYGGAGRELFLAMEYVEGVDLGQLLERVPFLSNLASALLFGQLCAGLSEAHRKGMIHRDVKPSNILVDIHGCVRIADFGLAWLADGGERTQTGFLLGTPQFMAPEQVEGRAASSKTDIFAAGAVLYRMLSGAFPFGGETSQALLQAVLKENPPPIRSHRAAVLPELDQLAQECLRKDPRSRPEAAEAAERIGKALLDRGLGADKSRLGGVLRDPKSAEGQDLELQEKIRDRGRAHLAAGRKASALKDFHLASAFGPLTAPESRILNRGRHWDRWKRRAAALLALALFGAGALAIHLQSKRPPEGAERPAPPPRPVAASQPAGREPGGDVPTALPPEPLSPDSAPPDSSFGILAAEGKSASGTGRNPRAERQPLSPPSQPELRQGLLSGLRPDPGSSGPGLERPPAPASPLSSPPREEGPRSGFLWVRTNPPFAEVFLDGKAAGTTPWAWPLALPPGEHRLLLRKEGAEDSLLPLLIAASETLHLRIELRKSGKAGP